MLNSPLPLDELTESLPDVRERIRRNPSDAASLHTLGLMLAQRGEYLRSYIAYRAAAARHPGFLYAAGSAALTLGCGGDASAYLEQAIAFNADHADAWQKRGELYLDHLRDPQPALDSYLRAIALAPEDSLNYQSAGRCLLNSDPPDAAIARLRDSQPPNADPLHAARGVAIALAESGRYDDAFPIFHDVLRERPADILSMRILAEMCDARRDPKAAQRWYERAMAAGDDTMATTGFIMHWSKRGDYDRARAVFLSKKMGDPGHWRGEAIPGKTLRLVAGDIYFGDALHFVRYARAAKQAGANVIVQCPVRLRNLLRTVEGVDATVAPHDPHPPLDFDVSAFWMTYESRIPVGDLMGGVPYLQAPPELLAGWRKRIVLTKGMCTKGVNAGIAWRGSPFRIRDPHGSRSMRLEDLRPLTQVPDLTLYSLQCGQGRTELLNAAPPFPAIDLAPDFPNTAAAIEVLDVVVTIDTSIAHLAGAMGKRTFLILPYDAFFTWMADGDSTPWYPSLTLFRQQTPGDWSGPVKAVARALGNLKLT